MNSIHPDILKLISQGKISLGGGHLPLNYLKELKLTKKHLHSDQKRLDKYLKETNQNN
jgi:hypothetical protein